MDDIAERWARDPETGKTYTVPGNMTYKQLAAKQEAIYGEGIIEKSREASYNISTLTRYLQNKLCYAWKG